jgi:hypothetical protein
MRIIGVNKVISPTRMLRKYVLPLIMLVTAMAMSVLTATPALAASSGPSNAGTGANVNGTGTISWVTAGGITADDSSFATAVLTTSATSEYLQGTNYGFAIPAGATINGITVTIGRMSSSNGGGNSINDVDLNLLKAGVIVGGDKAVATDWPITTITAASYGGTADLWGTTWTPAEINASNFGVSLSVVNQSSSSTRTASVDYMQITVNYTPVDVTAPTVTSVSSTLSNGSYTIGQLVPVQVNFSEAVIVTGVPQLALSCLVPVDRPHLQLHRCGGQ